MLVKKEHAHLISQAISSLLALRSKTFAEIASLIASFVGLRPAGYVTLDLTVSAVPALEIENFRGVDWNFEEWGLDDWIDRKKRWAAIKNQIRQLEDFKFSQFM